MPSRSLIEQTAAVPQYRLASDSTFCPKSRRGFVLVAAILASALGFIDGSIVAIAIPAIRLDIGAIAGRRTVDLQCLCADAVGADPGWRRRRRPIRPAPDLHRGIGLFVIAPSPARLALERRDAHRFTRVQGIGAAIMVPRQPGYHRKSLSESRAGQGDRHLGGSPRR